MLVSYTVVDVEVIIQRVAAIVGNADGAVVGFDWAGRHGGICRKLPSLRDVGDSGGYHARRRVITSRGEE
jgi:uncharacterized membrane protein